MQVVFPSSIQEREFYHVHTDNMYCYIYQHM
jgi:hypothetical protein